LIPATITELETLCQAEPNEAKLFDQPNRKRNRTELSGFYEPNRLELSLLS